MQQQTWMMTEAFQEAVRNGKPQDAIAAYIQAITKGVSLKLTFQSVLDKNDKITKDTVPLKQHQIISRTNFTIGYVSRIMDKATNKETPQNLSIHNISMNLPPLNLKGKLTPHQELVFFEQLKQPISPQDLIQILSQYYQNQTFQ